MYTGGCAVHSTAAFTLRPELSSSFTQTRIYSAGDGADAGDCRSTGCISSSASALFPRELSLSPAFVYSQYYYLRRRPAFLYRLPNPASYVNRLYGRWEVRCRESALLELATRRAGASSRRRFLSSYCVAGACGRRDPACLCRGLLEDAGEAGELEWKEEEGESGCCCCHDSALISGHYDLKPKKDVAETRGYGRERVSQRRDSGVTFTANDSATAIRSRKKINRVRTSGFHSDSTTDFSEDSQSQGTPHFTPSRGESTTKSRVQNSVHDTASKRNSHITSLSEITKQKDYSSKKVVDSRFSSKSESNFSSDSSSQVRPGHVHADKGKDQAERHSWEKSEVLNSSYQADHNQKKASEVEVDNSKQASLVASLVDEVRRQSIEIEKLRESYHALKHRSEVEMTHRTEAVTRMETNECSSSSIANLVEELRRQLIEINRLSKSYQELNSSMAYKKDTERQYCSNELSISNLNEREEFATSAMNLVNEAREQHIHHNQSRVDQRKAVNSSEIYETDRHRISSSYEVYKTKLREEEESSTSAIYITEEGKKQHKQKSTSIENSRKLASHSGIGKIENQDGCSLDTTLISVSDDKENKMASALHSMEEWREHHANLVQSEDRQKGSGSAKLPELYSKFGARPISSTTRPNEKEVASKFKSHANQKGKQHQEISTSQQIINMDLRLGSSNTYDEIGDEEIFLEANALSETGMVLEGKSSQLSAQDLKNDETEIVNILDKRSERLSNDSCENIDLSSVSTQMHMQQTQQLDQINKNDSFNERQDLLESARLQNASSSSYVAEFVCDLKKETAISQELDISLGHSLIYTGEFDKTDTRNTESEEINTGVQQSVKAVFNKSKSEKYIEEGLSQSEPLLQTGGPSDEMWDLSGSSQQACQKDKEKEASEDVVGEASAIINSGNAVAKRSGRSLWNLIADIIRLSWSSNAGKSNKSTTQSGTRSSSNESTGSEVWFSGHEPEEDCNDPSRQRRKYTEEESDVSSSHQETARLFPTKEGSTKPGNKDVKINTTSFAETSKIENASVGSSFLSGSLGLMVDEITELSIPSTSGTFGSSASKNTVLPSIDEIAGSSIPSASGTLISSASNPTVLPSIDKISGLSIPSGGLTSSASKNKVLSSVETGAEKFGKIPVHGISVGSLDLGLLTEESHEISEPGEIDSDLRRRKFQRNKQVLRDRFDEWEEGHKLETEQRKKDEFFMKEALLEAKKAAESWEVPIGAVLVQNDQIIARSGNMVEECRDSTAHAEIVCIREASKLLKSWRLSETTLYVTLEPCAMCAGAILQARIDTVVWGAPNKLLGADGSWVRLFPGGVEEKPSLDKADHTAGPIHPFHPKIIIRRGVLGTECADVMQQFFQLRRKEKKQETPGPSRLPVSKHPTRFFGKIHDMFSMMFCL